MLLHLSVPPVAVSGALLFTWFSQHGSFAINGYLDRFDAFGIFKESTELEGQVVSKYVTVVNRAFVKPLCFAVSFTRSL